jgi:hypothetical protein
MVKRKNMNAKEILNSWIESGDTERVLLGLSIVCKRWGHKDLSSDITFQTGRYKTLKDQQSKQIISQVDYQLESAKLRQALIDLIRDFPDHWTNEGLETIQQDTHLSSGGTNWRKWVVIAAGAVAFGGVVAEFSGYPIRDIFQSKS